MPMFAPAILKPVGFLAQNTTLQVLPNSNVTTVITGWTTIYDTSSGAWNAATGVFTVPQDGWYEMTGQLQLASDSYGVGDDAITNIIRNGSIVAAGQHRVESAVTTYELAPSTTAPVRCVKGDTLSLAGAVFYSAGGTKTLSGLGNYNFVAVIQLGNA